MPPSYGTFRYTLSCQVAAFDTKMKTKTSTPFLLGRLALLAALVAALLAACASPQAARRSEFAPRAVAAVAAPHADHRLHANVSYATTAQGYRLDAASHLYSQNTYRIFQGQLPPLIYAVGVLQLKVDAQGRLTQLSWLRAPTHAPEVVAEIERTVRRAAPFPAPLRMGRTTTYIETWLWDVSGRFQLHTLTEGQSYGLAQAAPDAPPSAEALQLAASTH